ncbi:SurA N-terminal domain-containing protein [Roseinatronobacter bogoriensis]|nr:MULTISPECIES: SurA N-terminal domain-containing protein [Rhodobaca]MBB4207176.1 peptidyl-prolyl cis-trans isomerase SurA [Rhodobaca bogoriensis DSM 18756]TDW40454.1 periplasmic chaperone for outer membrane proteins SurA [Rhodobaca barguzinensis]TDY70394.1 periplasmic chaperone for outer membrane proteins SurA [Rhodobaca bogoriensis DSM 18756]
MRLIETSPLKHFGLVLTTCLALVAAPSTPVQAQNMFAPARTVNDRVISNYDVDQRIMFLEVLNSGGADPRREALERLTEEAVQRDYARRLGIRVNRDEINEGMSEFAARADLSTEEFVAALAENGVDAQTFEAFVEAGLLWRKVVGQRFPALVAVSDSDVRRARDVVAILGRQRVLISEIFLPTDPEFADAVAQIMELIEAANSVEEFSNLAREFSLAGSRDEGGRIPDWVPVENLPGQISGPISQARPGQIIGPISLSGAIAYFQLRASESTRDIPADQVALRYKRLLLPGGRSEENLARVAQMRSEVRNCAGLGPFARGLPEDALVEREGLVNNLPQSDAIELARLDRNEISANTTDGTNLVVLMLCTRELQFEDAPSDDRVRDVLFDRRIGEMANVKLQELIADADVRDF